MSKTWKVILSVLSVVGVLAVVFIGLYFGVPQFHDWIHGIGKPEVIEPVEEGIETIARMLSL